MNFTRTIKTQTDRARNPNSSERDADVILIRDWARTKSAKEGADIAGMTPSGFKKIQSGETALSYEKLMRSMRNDPELRAALFVRAGGHLEVNPQQVAALHRALNSIARGDYSE